MDSFVKRLAQHLMQRKNNYALMLAPNIRSLPAQIQKYDEPFFPFGREVIKATHDLISVYVFDLASYLALGAAGGIALERTMRFVGNDAICILHGPFSGSGYTVLFEETALDVDAVTLTSSQHLDAYLQRNERTAFVLHRLFPDFLPERGGIYVPQNGLFAMRAGEDNLTFNLLGTASELAGTGEQFRQQLRHYVESRNEL